MAIKLTSSKSVGTNPAFAKAFEEFSEHLKQTKILLVWGYSFRDLEVLRYINQAFSQHPSLSVLYIDPYMSEEQTLRNINWTLGDTPISVDLKFKPKRIDWKPIDGHNHLVEAAVNSVKNIVA